ncbi:hypothetical protein KYI10_12825 (plasmid) [Macrococcus psychrotolerans]|uniref:Uncharacterized protein n=1 Tax=Macrococcus psychrotolerans TaxID=3039389 RepID=A0AAU7VH27_9STAP
MKVGLETAASAAAGIAAPTEPKITVDKTRFLMFILITPLQFIGISLTIITDNLYL